LSSSRPDRGAYVEPGGELGLLGADLRDFLAAVVERGAEFRFTARGASMYPFIRDGDAVTVSPLGVRPPRVGDVVAVRNVGAASLVVHRIVAQDGARYTTRGDNAGGADDSVPYSDLLGVVTRVERRGHDGRLDRGPAKRVVAILSKRGMMAPLSARAGRIVAPLRDRRAP
jgi:hypothetical protein